MFTMYSSIINRPAVAGAEFLKEFSPPTFCHIWQVSMPGITCQVSHFRCQVSGVIYLYTLFCFADNRQESQRQVSKPRTGGKVKDRQENLQKASKPRTGGKFEDRCESQQQARKSTTGVKAKDRWESWQQARKPRTCNKVEDRWLRQQQTESLFKKIVKAEDRWKSWDQM